MRYLAIPQGTADWLIGKSGLVDVLYVALLDESESLRALTQAEFVEGPFRVAAISNGNLHAVWNVDYLSGTGEESWGFIRITGELSLRNEPSIGREVFERCLYVINQRLQSLFIDGAFIHRAYPNGAHTCLAGRGNLARQFSIGYFERIVDTESSPLHAIICIGPKHEWDQLSRAAAAAAPILNDLVQEANLLITPGRQRVVARQDVLASVRRFLAPYREPSRINEYTEVEVATDQTKIAGRDALRTIGLSFTEWLAASSPLTDVQRRILLSDAIERHPLRIVGPGGSGKTLLMQLLALRRLQLARNDRQPLRVLYIVHNAAMAIKVRNRLETLQGKDSFTDAERILDICTLSDYGRSNLNLETTRTIDPDAYEAKKFQLDQLENALRDAVTEAKQVATSSKLFSTVIKAPELFTVLARLIMSEISTAIKGHGLGNDKRRYVQSERRLSRFHGILNQDERALVFDIFGRYHRAMFEGFEVLDTDDVALSLLGRLRTPIWELKRRQLGYDFVFVDEAQLFNENERRVLPLLTNARKPSVPIVLALDEAQDVYAQSTAGLATLGIPDIASESLGSIHRSTHSIVRLAFFVIQRSTDLFGPDFPDFTGMAEQMEPDNHALAAPPRIETADQDASRDLAKFVRRRIRELRSENLRQIAVICHADQYWEAIEKELRNTDLPLQILLQRGELLPPDRPVVVLTRPPFVGGQEFDAAILVGLEQGVVPPRVLDNDALSSAVEQQSLREMYLSITRARYRVLVVLSADATPNAVLQEAGRAGLIGTKPRAFAGKGEGGRGT